MGRKNKRKKNVPGSATTLAQPIHAADHILGNPQASITLVEYGSYYSTSCHVAHEVVSNLREEFGDQLRYVYRHFPLPDHEKAKKAAILSEYAALQTKNFWEVHDVLMDRESKGHIDLDEIAS